MAKIKGLYKRGNIWWIRYSVPPYFKVRYESSRSSNYKNALALLIERKKEVLEGKDPTITNRVVNHKFNTLADEYLVWAGRQKSIRRKRGIVNVLKKRFGHLNLNQMNTKLVEEYQSYMLDEGKAPATTNRHIACLKHIYTKAVDWEMVEEDILKKVRRVKMLAENNARLRYLSTEECEELINACKPHLRPIVITALNTGMRKEEILSLQWEKHIDLKHGFILLDITKNGSRREVPMNRSVKTVFTNIVRRVDSPYVFVDQDGRRYKNVYRSFKTACRQVGIKDFRFHDMRHTFASRLVMAGVDILAVKELLGHKTLSMTLRYSHLAPSHRVKAVEVLDDLKPEVSVSGSLQ